jgi:hypothetical protein
VEFEMTDQPKITIDGKDYLIDSLSDEAKNQLGGLNLVDRKIVDLQQEIAIMQTARNAYAQALAAALPKN